MLTCIACTKQVEETGGEDGARGTPSTKDAVKSLTSQIKDMALKLSGAHKQSKPSAGASSSGGRGQPACPDLDTICQGIRPHPYVRCGSTGPRWGDDFARANRYQPAAAVAARSNGGDDRMGGGRVAGGVVVEASGNSRGEVVLVEDEEEAKEWLAQVEPGVQITFVALPQGGNDLKRIRFSREMFNKWEAQRWWGENYDRIMELYNVQRFNRQALPTPPRSEDERESSYYSRIGSSSRESPVTPPLGKERLPRNCYRIAATATTTTEGKGGSMMIPPDLSEYSQQLTHHAPPSSSSTYCYGGGLGSKAETSSVDASRTTTSSRDEASISISNVSDLDTEWVEQDEPGVYITIRALPDGTRELRRVRFSRERFGEVHAKLWWEQNRERIQAQYL